MVLLNCDVARFCFRAVDLVLLLNHDRREASSPCRVTKNVPDVVVTKHQGGSREAAKRVVAEHVHPEPQTAPLPLHTAGHGKSLSKRGILKRNLSAVRLT